MRSTLARPLAAGVFLVSLVASAAAGTSQTVDTFEQGVNLGGWTWGPPPVYPATGGNPGQYLRGSVDTFAPMLRTTAPSSPFTGNYRASRVTGVGVDLRTFSTQFSFQRELSLILHSGSCSVYRLGTDFVPAINAPWKPFDIAIPSQSTTLPAGWSILSSSACQAPNATWNQVITNVTKVEFFYGNPENFFIFDIWNVGADNVRIARETDFTNLGHALAGTLGNPVLAGSGEVTAGQTVTITLSNALPNTTAFLLTGLSQINAPFLGGVLVPDVSTTNFVLPLPTGPSGSIVLSTAWPASIPPGTTIYLQYWIADPAGLFGAAASNGLAATSH